MKKNNTLHLTEDKKRIRETYRLKTFSQFDRGFISSYNINIDLFRLMCVLLVSRVCSVWLFTAA